MCLLSFIILCVLLCVAWCECVHKDAGRLLLGVDCDWLVKSLVHTRLNLCLQGHQPLEGHNQPSTHTHTHQEDTGSWEIQHNNTHTYSSNQLLGAASNMAPMGSGCTCNSDVIGKSSAQVRPVRRA